jgi:glucokinase
LLQKFGADVLVLGGNISLAWDSFGAAFEARLAKERCACRVELSELKEDAALLGAAYLFDGAFWRSVQHALPLMSEAAK